MNSTIDITPTEIEAAYDRLAYYLGVAADTDLLLADYESKYTHVRMTAIHEGKITGSNPEKRKASEYTLLTNERLTLENARNQAKRPPRDLEMARLRVDSLRLKVRLLEVEVMATLGQRPVKEMADGL